MDGHTQLDGQVLDRESPQVVRGNRHKRLLSEAIQLEEQVVPEFIRPLLLLVAVLVVAFVAWAGFVNINEVATAPGEVIPSGSVKVVEHLEGGVVAEVLVEEGDKVEKGQLLARLDGGQGEAELQQLEDRHLALRLRAERLAAFSEGREPDFASIGGNLPELVAGQQQILKDQLSSRRTSRSVITSQIEQRKRELAQLKDSLVIARQQQKLTSEMVVMRKKMVDRKLIPRMEFLETQRAKVTADGEVGRINDEIKVAQQTITESRRRLADLDAQLKREASAELGGVSAEIAEVRSGIAQIKDRVNRLEIKAPTAGQVQDLRVLTVGQVVQPGGLMMRVVPADRHLEAEVKIATNDIGHVTVGQDVLVKVGSYDYTRFGGVNGVLHRISATSLVEDGGEAFFRGWVRLEHPYVGKQEGKYKIVPGMGVQADIQTGNKTLLQYLLKPLTDALNRAFRER